MTKFDRYARQQLIGWWDQRKLQKARIIVFGVGALGNELVKNLALLGIGHLLLVDFDTIEGDGSVTVRNRDTTEQARFNVEEAIHMIEREINP